MSLRRLGLSAAVLGLAAAGTALVPGSAKAWWSGGWGWHGGFSVGIVAPPIVVAPPPVYVAPPPVVYAPPPPPPPGYYAPPRPGAVWIPGHWQGGYWVPAHWA